MVDSGCSHFRPLAFPDTVNVGVRVAKLGSSSVRYELAVYRKDDTAPSAAGHFVHVYVDRRTNQSVPIPDAVKLVLETIAVAPSE
ncbi:MAG: thioesterase [Massilia sp.]|nr:thioesterase [Massilia sp.]